MKKVFASIYIFLAFAVLASYCDAYQAQAGRNDKSDAQLKYKNEEIEDLKIQKEVLEKTQSLQQEVDSLKIKIQYNDLYLNRIINISGTVVAIAGVMITIFVIIFSIFNWQTHKEAKEALIEAKRVAELKKETLRILDETATIVERISKLEDKAEQDWEGLRKKLRAQGSRASDSET